VFVCTIQVIYREGCDYHDPVMKRAMMLMMAAPLLANCHCRSAPEDLEVAAVAPAVTVPVTVVPSGDVEEATPIVCIDDNVPD
jgi:hypothetical protein